MDNVYPIKRLISLKFIPYFCSTLEIGMVLKKLFNNLIMTIDIAPHYKDDSV